MKRFFIFVLFLANCTSPQKGYQKKLNRCLASGLKCSDIFLKKTPLNFQEHTDVSLGDLTHSEIQKIQAEVDRSGIQVIVVGSAAKASRRNVDTDLPLADFSGSKKNTKSDIDYVVKNGLDDTASLLRLPDMDNSWGVRGVDYINLDKGPIIVFTPNNTPILVTGSGRLDL